MSSITIENLSRKEALQLLKNVQKNAAPSYAIQGKQENRYVNTDTVCATVQPCDSGWNGYDFSKNTFKIYSNYWSESTLRDYISE